MEAIEAALLVCWLLQSGSTPSGYLFWRGPKWQDAPAVCGYGVKSRSRIQLCSLKVMLSSDMHRAAFDSTLVEYDIELRNPEPGLRAVCSTVICPDAGVSPSAFTFAPPQPYYDKVNSADLPANTRQTFEKPVVDTLDAKVAGFA